MAVRTERVPSWELWKLCWSFSFFFFFSFFAFNEGEVYLVKFPQLKFPFKSARLLRITLPTGQPYHRTPRGEEKKYK